jgi:hypothetical protein
MPFAVHAICCAHGIDTLCFRTNHQLHCQCIVSIQLWAQLGHVVQLLRGSGGKDAVTDCNSKLPTGTAGARGHLHRSGCWLHVMQAGEQRTLICWQKQTRTSRSAALHHVCTNSAVITMMLGSQHSIYQGTLSRPHCRTPPCTLYRSYAWCIHFRAPHTWPPGVRAGSSYIMHFSFLCGKYEMRLRYQVLPLIDWELPAHLLNMLGCTLYVFGLETVCDITTSLSQLIAIKNNLGPPVL